MEIFTLLESMEDILENSKEIPLMHKTLVDKTELLDIIKDIRLKVYFFSLLISFFSLFFNIIFFSKN